MTMNYPDPLLPGKPPFNLVTNTLTHTSCFPKCKFILHHFGVEPITSEPLLRHCHVLIDLQF